MRFKPKVLLIVVVSLSWGALIAQVSKPAASVLPSGGGQALLDPSDIAILLLDHQAGLLQTVKDIGITELRANTALLAKLAALCKIPLITTASEPNGQNGPLLPEIQQSLRRTPFTCRAKVKSTHGTTTIS